MPSPCHLSIRAVIAAVFGLCLLQPAQSARAADAEQLQREIDRLQQELNELRAAQTGTPPASPAAPAAPAAAQTSAAQVSTAQPAAGTGPMPIYGNSKVDVTLGGFFETTGIFRSKWQGTDVASKWNLGANGMPLPNSPNNHMTELRGTVRQSRLSVLVQGQNEMNAYSGYGEFDFLGAGNTSNSSESNSYVPRIRHLYGAWDDPPEGWHVLVGQNWSLLTMHKQGMLPRRENIPLVVDAQYVPGFTWDRTPQARVVKDWYGRIWAGLSIESPQASINNGNLPAAPAACTGYNSALPNGGCVYYNTSTTFLGTSSVDAAPDIVAKVAIDPSWGHVEVYGVMRFLTDRVLLGPGSGGNHTAIAGGGGAAILLPIIPKRLELQASALVGRGIGRFGSAQFNDAVVDPTSGQLAPIPEVEGLIGVIGHPTENLDLFAYGGVEAVKETSVNGRFGLGSPAAVTGSCWVEGAASCNAQAHTVWQGTIGAWYTLYHGDFGAMKLALTNSYTRLTTFANGPNSDEDVVMLSFRYFPFQ